MRSCMDDDELDALFEDEPPQATALSVHSNNVTELKAYQAMLLERIKASSLKKVFPEQIGPPSVQPGQKCINCLQPFDTSPIGIPLTKVHVKMPTKWDEPRIGEYAYKTFGGACTFSCALSFIKYDHHFRHNRMKSELLLKEMFQHAIRHAEEQTAEAQAATAPTDAPPMLFKPINPLCIHTPLISRFLHNPVMKHHLEEAPPRVLLAASKADGGMSVDEFRRMHESAVYELLLPPCISTYALLEATVADLGHLDSLIEWNERLVLPDKQSAMIQAPKHLSGCGAVTPNALQMLKEQYNKQCAQLAAQGYTAAQIKAHFERETNQVPLQLGKLAPQPTPKKRGRKPKASTIAAAKPSQSNGNCRPSPPDLVQSFGIFTEPSGHQMK